MNKMPEDKKRTITLHYSEKAFKIIAKDKREYENKHGPTTWERFIWRLIR